MEETLSHIDLRNNEERFLSFINNSAYGYVEFDREGNITFANRSIMLLSGYTVDDKLNFKDLIVEEDLPRAVSDLNRAIEKPNDGPKEYRIKRKDGTIMDIEVDTLPIYASDTVIGFQSTVLDISHRKGFERRIIESETKYRLLVETTKDMIFRGRLDGTIDFMNKAVERTLGYTKEELSNMNSFKGIHPDYRDRVEFALNRLMHGEGISNAELRYKVKNGIYIDISVSAEPVYDAHSNVIGFTAIARDITFLKNVQRELKKSQSIAEAYMNATTDAGLLIDINGTIVDVNTEFVRRFSTSKQALIGTKVYDLFSDDVAARRREIGRKVIETGKPHKFQDERDGMWNEASIHPLFDEDGNVSHLVIFTHDITAFKEMEAKLTESSKELEKKVLQRTAELEEVNTALRVLVKSRDTDLREIERRILFNMNKLVIPNLEELKNILSEKKQQILMHMLEKNLSEITSRFVSGPGDKYLSLTPAEIKIANLIKHGKTNKEIAQLCHLSPRTVESHRDSIRRKIGIKNKKINLRSYLMSNKNT